MRLYGLKGLRMNRSYEIVPRPANLGGGWKLTLLEDGQEAGGGVFPIPEEDEQACMDWFNGMNPETQWHWLTMGTSVTPAAARHAYLMAEAYADARQEGENWSSP
jgi:hypothetical protein